MFVKLFTQILDSSIADDRRLRHFFTDILLCADAQGFVMMTESAIARRIGTTVDEVKWGMRELLKPDPRSKTPDHEGKRIETVVGSGYGWRIINFEAYKALRSAEDMREKTRERVRRFRDKSKELEGCNADVTPCNAGNAIQRKKKSKRKNEEEVPPSPQGGTGKPRKRKSNPDNQRVTENTPTMIRINDWFGRRPDTLWTISEARVLEEVDPSEAEIDGMETFYTADEKPDDPLFRRTAIITLLNNWRKTELDKARGYARRKRNA